MTKKFQTVDEYIANCDKRVRLTLQQIRNLLKETAPQATEIISYNMPALKTKKVLVFYAAFKNHIGFYALPSGNTAFQEKLKNYKIGKGSIQFPLDEPIPFELIKEILLFRLEEVG